MYKDTRRYEDRKEYLKQAVIKRRRTLKKKAVDLLGGACAICGYSKHPGILDFHHIDPKTKSFGISAGGFSRSWNKVEAELTKCVLVCANCHRELELGLAKLPKRYLQREAQPVE